MSLYLLICSNPRFCYKREMDCSQETNRSVATPGLLFVLHVAGPFLPQAMFQHPLITGREGRSGRRLALLLYVQIAPLLSGEMLEQFCKLCPHQGFVAARVGRLVGFQRADALGPAHFRTMHLLD